MILQISNPVSTAMCRYIKCKTYAICTNKAKIVTVDYALRKWGYSIDNERGNIKLISFLHWWNHSNRLGSIEANDSDIKTE